MGWRLFLSFLIFLVFYLFIYLSVIILSYFNLFVDRVGRACAPKSFSIGFVSFYMTKKKTQFTKSVKKTFCRKTLFSIYPLFEGEVEQKQHIKSFDERSEPLV